MSVAYVGKMEKCVDKKGCDGALLTDLSKAFDCLPHDLFIAKLDAYGFNYESLKLIYSYLTNRYQRVRINSQFSPWAEIEFGAPQGSILGPLFFNIYIADLFWFSDSNLANFADDNTPYALESDIELVVPKVENDSKNLFEWFEMNMFKSNPAKSHLILSSNDTTKKTMMHGIMIQNETRVELLGVTIDNALLFDSHVTNLCKKASNKLHALARISSYMDLNKRKSLMNAFFVSQFSYCPLIWMCHSRTLNKRINRLHERSLRIVYRDSVSTFEELLERDHSFTIHERNIQSLCIEMFKVKLGISPQFMNEIFPLKEKERYHSKQIFVTHNVRTVTWGYEYNLIHWP